jgi:CAAX prenyl protease-like protein
MDSISNDRARSKLLAYTVPMGLFVGLLALVSLIKQPGAPFWLAAPEFWLYPLQTLLCAGALAWFWREYEFQRLQRAGLVIAVGVIVFLLWISPQAFFGFGPRSEGFNPDLLATQPFAYWSSVLLRFLRLVIIVPLVEEIFWRGFLLRYFINEKFYAVPFGTFSWLSFAAVTAGFTFIHNRPDWPAAAITGALYNFVAYRTRSLASCVLVHAITNLLLGLWIMKTRQWGFW